MKKKFLSALLAIAILATSLPLNLFSAVTAGGDNEAAAPGVYNGESVTKDGVTLSKEAVQVGLDEYEITLKLTGGGTALERQPHGAGLRAGLLLQYGGEGQGHQAWGVRRDDPPV